MVCLQIEEGRLQTDLKLLSTLIWSAAVFELFDTPAYKRLTHMLSGFKHLNKDAESVRRVQEVLPSHAACNLGFGLSRTKKKQEAQENMPVYSMS